MKENRKWHIVLLFLAGMLISVMIVFMRLGGGVNFEEFMSAGQVYDVKPSELKKSTPGWLYDSQNGVHQLLRKKSRIKYNLDEKPLAWNYLYITVEQLSTESVQGLLRYYGGRNKKILDQPITLTPGRNTIEMDGAVPVRKIGIVILDAKEEFISISQVQVRTTPSWFTVPHFLEMFAVVYAVVKNRCCTVSEHTGRNESIWRFSGKPDGWKAVCTPEGICAQIFILPVICMGNGWECSRLGEES